MKFLLIVYVCINTTGDCRHPPEYPSVKNSYYECIHDGLGESYELLFGSESLFTREMINNEQLFARYTCNPIEDEGKIAT